MKVLLDTSVLVAAMVEAHPHHTRALPWLQRAKCGEIKAVVAAHTLAELYAILTRLPLTPLIPPGTAWKLIQENILSSFEVISLTPEDYRAVLQHLSRAEIAGGATYDALIIHAGSKAGVDQIVTLNEQDFRRVYPELPAQIVVP